MDQSTNNLFSNRRLLLLILPLFLEQCLANLVGMVDSVMVSSVGEFAVSGVSLVNNISSVVINLLTALAAGGGIVTSQFLGARRERDAKHSTGQLLTMTVGVSMVVMAVCLIFARPLLRLFFGAIEQDVMEAASTYFFYNALSFPFLALYSACSAILRADGNSKTSFYVSLLRNAVNLIGNALCIYGLGMGVEGVAIPTAFSRLVGAGVMVLAVAKNHYPLRPDLEDLAKINFPLMGKMLRVGLPTAVESSIFQLGRVATLSMISGFGTYQIAANSTANSLVGFVVTVTSSIGVASLTVLGQCVGAKDLQQIRKNSRKLMALCYAANGIASALVILLRFPLIHLYQNLSPETVDLAAKLMCIHLGSGILLYPTSFLFPYFLRAANDSAYPMFVSIASMVVFRLTLSYILCVTMGYGAIGVWCAMVIDWVSRSAFFLLRWARGKWKKKIGLDEKIPA